MKTALVVVDVQNDFCEGGSLAVAGGIEVAEKIRDYLKSYRGLYDVVYFTKDWHKDWPDTNGGHFSENPDFVDSWPVHCVENTPGAEFHPAVAEVAADDIVFKKGNGQPDYSGVQAFSEEGTYLADALEEAGITDINVVGIAGDYCVRETALDLKARGFNVRLIPNMVASVRGEAGTDEALQALANA